MTIIKLLLLQIQPKKTVIAMLFLLKKKKLLFLTVTDTSKFKELYPYLYSILFIVFRKKNYNPNLNINFIFLICMKIYFIYMFETDSYWQNGRLSEISGNIQEISFEEWYIEGIIKWTLLIFFPNGMTLADIRKVSKANLQLLSKSCQESTNCRPLNNFVIAVTVIFFLWNYSL